MDNRTDDKTSPVKDAAASEKGPEPEGTGAGDIPRKEQRIAHFIRQLSSDDEVTRWRSAEELGRIGDPVAVDPLIEALWDDDARVRLKAVWALGAIGDMRAVPSLRRLYRLEREGTREIISEAIEEINRDGGDG